MDCVYKERKWVKTTEMLRPTFEFQISQYQLGKHFYIRNWESFEKLGIIRASNFNIFQNTKNDKLKIINS